MQTEALRALTEALPDSRSDPWEALLNLRSGLLEEEERRTASTKGKAKATEQDEEEEAVFRRRIEEIDIALSDIRDTGQDQGKLTRPASYAMFDLENGPESASVPSKSSLTVADDEEPIWNPLTSSYASRETGYEPGPSGLSGKSRQRRQSIKTIPCVSSDTSLDVNSNFPGSSPVWMQYPEQPQQEFLRGIPENPTEVYAGAETLRTGPPAGKVRTKAAPEDVEFGDD